jgi:predicted methyltransferase
MKRNFWRTTTFVVSVALMVGACATTDYRAILTSADRPDADKKLDEVRKPHEVMAFYGVKKGDKVADLFAARGYYTAVLSQVVGADGMVYSANQTARPELHERVKQPSMRNVRVIDGPFDKLELPQDGSLDFVLIHLDYHELLPDVRVAMNRRVFGALKRGGTYGVVDHSAIEGSGDRDAKTLHRIDKRLVIKEVTSVGFRLDKEGTMLSRPDDTRDFSVTKIRDRSDRFVLKFEKP